MLFEKFYDASAGDYEQFAGPCAEPLARRWYSCWTTRP
jgi:hypothetical protein